MTEQTPEEDIENTQEFPPYEDSHEPEPEKVNYVAEFRKSGLQDVNLLDKAIEQGRIDIRRHVEALDAAIDAIPDDKRSHRLAEFRETYKKDRLLDNFTLNTAVDKDDLHGAAREHRSKIWSVLKSIPHA